MQGLSRKYNPIRGRGKTQLETNSVPSTKYLVTIFWYLCPLKYPVLLYMNATDLYDSSHLKLYFKLGASPSHSPPGWKSS